jgi:hypothetical protein
MSDLVKMGPPDNQELPKKSLGSYIFQENKEMGRQQSRHSKDLRNVLKQLKRFDFRLIGQAKN